MESEVRKHRVFYAPFLIWIGGPLLRILDTGVRVLPQREWVERERQIYQSLHGTSIRIEADGTLVLPRLAGETLAAVLEDPAREERSGRRPSNGRSSPSPSSTVWGLRTGTPWPRTC